MSITNAIEDLINTQLPEMTPTERRIAQLIRDDPETVAFGTCASVGKAAATSAPSIVRFAAKLGLEGFTDLQTNVRRDLTSKTSSAYKRARVPAARQNLAAWIEIEMLNVQETLTAVDQGQLTKAVALLKDPKRRVFILPSEQWIGPATTFYDFLQLVRGRVKLLHGTPIRVASLLSAAEPNDVLLTMDAQRNEKWVVESHASACALGLQTITITDSPLNPLAQDSNTNFHVSRATCGLFDSKTGLTALLNYLLDCVCTSLGEKVVERLEKSEALWSSSKSLT